MWHPRCQPLQYSLTAMTNEKLDHHLEELGCKQPSDSPTLCSESDPPDGGRRAWATAFGCFLVQFCGYGYVSSFGVYQDFYLRIYLTNQSPSAISWIGSLNSFLIANLTLISGLLYDRGWFYQLMIAGSLIQSLSLFMLSFAQPGQFYFIFIAQGVLSGIGMGLTYGPSMAVISQYFLQKTHVSLCLSSRLVHHWVPSFIQSCSIIFWMALLALREASAPVRVLSVLCY
ncbi:mycorrhiza-upregulated monocarboxylate permease [Suillus ampliporus]|nr:mycorrhiza-upregulated monocarboxylate permease [Suillus ampliporus]